MFESAQMFLRVCGRNHKVIDFLSRTIEKCRKVDPVNADYAIEQGRQLILNQGTDSQADQAGDNSQQQKLQAE